MKRNISKDWRYEKKKEQHFSALMALHCVPALPVGKKLILILVLEVHFRDRSRSKS